MRSARIALSIVASAAIAALGLAAPTPASSTSAPAGDPIASGLVGPLQFEVSGNGRIYVGQSFAGLLSVVNPNGKVVNLTAEEGSITGVAADRGRVAYTFRGGDGPPPELGRFGNREVPAAPIIAQLKLRRPDGTVRIVADLGKYESKRNPDKANRYGFRGLSAGCLAELPPDFAPYHGLVDSNPYALLETDGGWYVADAGANAIFKVTKKGKISTYAVLKPQLAKITAEVAEMFELPDCVVGKSYAFEPVPTDVEWGKDGRLLGTLLPGGPEDASLGARGSLVSYRPNGKTDTLAAGFLGATNLAVGPGKRVFVAELFGNRVAIVRDGKVVRSIKAEAPGGLEYVDGRLIASTEVFTAGNLVQLSK